MKSINEKTFTFMCIQRFAFFDIENIDESCLKMTAFHLNRSGLTYLANDFGILWNCLEIFKFLLNIGLLESKDFLS